MINLKMIPPGAVKKKMISPSRKLNYLLQYINDLVDNWPKKQKPFDIWLESTLDKRAAQGQKEERKYFRKICRYCRQEFEQYEIDLLKTKDHIIPLSKGGLDLAANKVPCCHNCNQWKADKMPEDWLAEVQRWAKKRIDNPKYTIAQIGLMVSNIKAVCKYAKDNQKRISMYKV